MITANTPSCKNILVITQDFPPDRTSCAQQMQALVHDLASRGYTITVVTFSAKSATPKFPESTDTVVSNALKEPLPVQSSAAKGTALKTIAAVDLALGPPPDHKVSIVRLPSWRLRPSSLLWRLISEIRLSWTLRNWFVRGGHPKSDYAAIIWYSPSIFLGFGLWLARLKPSIPKYLILRDIYPDWSWDLGLIPLRIGFWILDWIARRQYHLATHIGVQSPGNIPILTKKSIPRSKIQVLANWQPLPALAKRAPESLLTLMRGYRVLLYAGNMGLAQDIPAFLTYASGWSLPGDVRFVFVGRGSQVTQLKALAKTKGWDHVVFHPEISPAQLADAFAYARMGLIVLSWSHHSHNIPGKLMAYLAAGLPVAAWTAPQSDLAQLITNQRLGLVFAGHEPFCMQDREGLLGLLGGAPLWDETQEPQGHPPQKPSSLIQSESSAANRTTTGTNTGTTTGIATGASTSSADPAPLPSPPPSPGASPSPAFLKHQGHQLFSCARIGDQILTSLSLDLHLPTVKVPPAPEGHS